MFTEQFLVLYDDNEENNHKQVHLNNNLINIKND